MEKHTTHYSLTAIKAAVQTRGVDCFTSSALRGIHQMGLSASLALHVIQALDRSMFYKSMTTHADHRIWQDVYHAKTPYGPAYVKFTLREEDSAIVISFKAL